jgi:hypothetical protein
MDHIRSNSRACEKAENRSSSLVHGPCSTTIHMLWITLIESGVFDLFLQGKTHPQVDYRYESHVGLARRRKPTGRWPETGMLVGPETLS